jgi:ribosomal protein S18 acetylase RimI-like enzyme
MMDRDPYLIRAIEERDKVWVNDLIKSHWGDDFVVIHDQVYYPDHLPGFIARNAQAEPVGLVTYQVRGKVCEIITLNSLLESQGVGSMLMAAVREEAEKANCSQMCLTTTNDNQDAIEFYKNRGFRLGEIRKGAVDRARELKPSIPKFSPTGVPICDEWKFVLDLSDPSKSVTTLT